MKLEAGSKAYKAYTQGRLAAQAGRTAKDANPYVTAKMIGLSNWFMKGYNEVQAEQVAKKAAKIVE